MVNASGAAMCVLPYNWTQSAECCDRWGCGCPQLAACVGVGGGGCQFPAGAGCTPRVGCPQNGGGFHHATASCSVMGAVTVVLEEV